MNDDLDQIAKANIRHDIEHGNPKAIAPIKSTWNEARLIMRKQLTDRKIKRYQKEGWYSAEFRQERKDRAEKKARKHRRKDGNFEITEDGRLIYKPI